MTINEAVKEFEFDCKIRHLSPKTIDNYRKQLRYLQRFLEREFSISVVGDVEPSHIKEFLSAMDDAGRKPQYTLWCPSCCEHTQNDACIILGRFLDCITTALYSRPEP